MKQQLYLLLIIALCFKIEPTWAQSDTLKTDIYEMSLEELMNVQVVSASKKSESLFDAPLSTSALSREEIKNSGATSIMEALRLIPGVVVREETNGNYDIHVRGLDNVPPNTYQVYSANTTTLVMIDNRPVYNYLQGGTFWETLPIDLNDVEKIEVVRGPSSTLYGPNAVSGVIHIITRKTDKKGWNILANSQIGTHTTRIVNASIGYQFNDKWNAMVSANHQFRGRESLYYDYEKDRMVTSPDSVTSAPEIRQDYPHPKQAMNKYGVNTFLNYTPTEKVQFSLSSGWQDSEAQNAYGALSGTSLSTTTSQTHYVDVKSHIHGLTSQFSYLSGKHDPNLGFVGSTFDFTTLDASSEYDWKIGSLSLKPGITYRSAIYDDTNYWNASQKQGFLSGKKRLETYAGALRAEYTLLEDRIRLVAGARFDKFTYPSKWFFSYQLAANFKLTDNHLLRAVYSRAYRAPFMYDTYVDRIVLLDGDPAFPANSSPRYTLLGNKNLNLVQSDMIELGYRGKLAENFYLDVEAYATKVQNYTNLIVDTTLVSYVPTAPKPLMIHTFLNVQNLPLVVYQKGTTVSVNYVVGKLQVKPFVSFQQTTLENYSVYSNTSRASPSSRNGGKPSENNLNSGIGSKIDHKFTPTVYGGAFINYQLSAKVNLNLNSYFYSAQTFYHQEHLQSTEEYERGVEHIRAKFFLNAKLSYMPVKALSIFVSAKNLLNDRSKEYYYTDQIGNMFLAGVSFHY